MTHPYYLAALAPSIAATGLLLALTGYTISRWRREAADARAWKKSTQTQPADVEDQHRALLAAASQSQQEADENEWPR